MPLFSRRFWPHLALAALAVVGVEPLTHVQVMCTDDWPFHLFRAVELGRLVELGHWFPRWAPHMAQGYGYPFFNFYAPLSSYFVAGLHGTGLAYPLALRVAFGLTLWLAGLSTFLFVRDLYGERAGLAAGAAYLLAPYLAYDVLYRGNFAETLAFVWPPLVLLSLKRGLNAWGTRLKDTGPKASEQPVQYQTSVVAITYAALILTHNVFALIASPLVFGYAALAAWQQPAGRARWLAWAWLSLLAGVALSAYFWLPALVERGLVFSDRLLVPPIFTWYTNFTSLRELLGPLPPFDPRLVNPSPPRTIGLVTVLVALPALGAAFSRGSRRRPGFTATVVFFALALAGYCLLNLEVSAPIWRLLKPLELVQFPWRMLGPAVLCAAVLVGASVAGLEDALSRFSRPRLAQALPAMLAVGAVSLGALPAWHAIYCPSDPAATVADLVGHEQHTNTTGTTAKGEYLPRTVRRLPADPALAQALAAGEEPSRLWLPANSPARVLSASVRDPLNATFEIETPAAADLVYRQFHYPGWRVTLDGQATPIRATPEEGLITFTLPPGTHRVHVMFGLTPLRAAAIGLSLLTLVTLAMLDARRVITRSARSWPATEPPGQASAELTQPRTAAVLLAICAVVPLLKLGLLDRLRPSPAENPVKAQYPLLTNVAGGVRLYGYDLSNTIIPGDGTLDVAWYAGQREPSLRRYWPAVALEDNTGLTWSVLNPLPPRWHREPKDTPEWGPGQYAQWARVVAPLPGTPPGQYALYGWIFDRDSLQIASVLDEAGNASGPRLLLETVTLTRPRRPYGLVPPRPAVRVFGPLRLLGYDLDRTTAAAGEALALSLYWRSQQATPQDWLARIELLDGTGNVVYAVEVEPANGYATRHWQVGDQWLGQTRLRLPASLPAGDYVLAVSVPGTDPGRQVLGSVRVEAPQRTFEALPFDTPSGAAFGEVAVLEGFTLQRADSALTVTLVWRATASPAESYAAFVHLADDTGRVWAQSDAVPAAWTRPTTGWVAGEYIGDVHTLAVPAGLPAGSYKLWVGLYDPLTGRRLTASGPGTASDQRVWIGDVNLP